MKDIKDISALSRETEVTENFHTQDTQNKIPFYRVGKETEDFDRIQEQKISQFMKKVYRKKPVQFWTDDEVKRMLSLTKGRDYVIIGLGYFCALRVNELRQIKVSDINFKEMKVWVYGKGGIRSYVPMLPDGNIFWVDLKKWIEGEPLDSFVIRGRQKDGSMSNRHINNIIRKYANLANISFKEKAHFHMLRHSRISYVFSKTGNIEYARRIARHKKTRITEETYIHLGVEDEDRKIARAIMRK
jgi:integrase